MQTKTDGFELLKNGISLAAFKKYIKANKGIDKKDKDGNSYLAWAIIKSNTPVALYLIDAGCRINSSNEQKITTLEYAIQFGELTIVEKLLAKKVKFFERDGYIPLHAAAVSGKRKLIKRMLSFFPNVNWQDNGGYTPLHWACQEGQLASVTELIANGAIVNILDNGGLTPLRAAQGGGHIEVFNYLVKHKAIVGDFSWHLLLHNSVAWGQMEISKTIIESGSDVNALDRYGNTPLHYALMYNLPKFEQLLIKMGADTGIRNRFGMLPLEADLEKFDDLTDSL